MTYDTDSDLEVEPVQSKDTKDAAVVDEKTSPVEKS